MRRWVKEDLAVIYVRVFCLCFPLRVSLVVQPVKSLSTMQETQVQSLGWEDPQKKEMATHSSILAWKIPWMEEPQEL